MYVQIEKGHDSTVGMCCVSDFPLYFEFDERLNLLESTKKDVELFTTKGPLQNDVIYISGPERWLGAR